MFIKSGARIVHPRSIRDTGIGYDKHNIPVMHACLHYMMLIQEHLQVEKRERERERKE